MNKLTAAAVAAASLFALPALAQSTTAPNNQQSASSPSAMSQADVTKLQQKITHDLQGDGYTDVHVVPDSFLVHAMNKRHEAVVMIINPNSVFEMTGMPSGNGAQNSPAKN